MSLFTAVLLALLFLGDAGDPQIFSGEISDSQCAFNVHSHNSSHDDMIKTKTMGSTPEECAKTCVRQSGGKFVLIDPVKKKIYRLSPQADARDFGGKKVRIRGVYDKDEDLLRIGEIKPL
jgi:hypothetical protein